MLNTFMFPGQGSQAKGMGGALFDRFADLTAQADAVLGYSIRALCVDDPRDELGRTQFTQPALYVVNALTYYANARTAARRPIFSPATAWANSTRCSRRAASTSRPA